jgi:hypothetical protein
MAHEESEDGRALPGREIGAATGQMHANLLLIDLGRRVDKIEGTVQNIEGTLAEQDLVLAENTKITTATSEKVDSLDRNLAGAVKFFKALDGTITLGAMAGKFAKWVTIVGAAVGVCWFLIKYIVVEIVKGMK